MDDNNMHVNERKSDPNSNGSVRRSPGASNLQSHNHDRPNSYTEQGQLHATYTVAHIKLNRDEKGYGMKVSGDNPVYVQSVKQGGAAEKAGLCAGDKIIVINGVNVRTSTHTDVVDLIRSASQVMLIVHKRVEAAGTPTRPSTLPASHQITGPQPVDMEKLQQLQIQKKQHILLMLEKEERHLEMLRSRLAVTPSEKNNAELAKTERNLLKLQGMLQGNNLGTNESLNQKHHRTKSSPESITTTLSPAEASRRLIASESMGDLRHDDFNENATPPGTPPPPYPSPDPTRRHCSRDNEDGSEDTSMSYHSPLKELESPIGGKIVANTSCIQAASANVAQQEIMSMEDDEISDQEVNQLDDHGPFKSLSKLWENTPHLVVFMNYVLLNSEPSSLLFYLLTDLYKEGNAKDMRKWAYEIHSCFLVPGAPLRLSNVDENIAHEIDDVLLREYDKEEILRKIFWKARNRAKEELTKQLNHFQQKITAGLGNMYGLSEAMSCDGNHDKAKETKIFSTLLDKLESFAEEIEKDVYDPKRYYTGIALATVMARVFGVRVVPPLDRFPTFVNKEKSFRQKFIRYSRKLNVQGHHFTAQQYYTVMSCNHCHQIIYGIGPQGYQCSDCLINLHRQCVKLYEDSCPGPISKKNKSIGITVMERIRKLPQSHSDKRQDDKDVDSLETGDMKPNQLNRTDSDRRTEAKSDSATTQDDHDHARADNEEDVNNMETTKSLPATSDKKKNASNINRSESVKESTNQHRKPNRRNISDPLHNNSDSANIDPIITIPLSGSTGSSSNSSINSNSRYSNESPSGGNPGCDSDGNVELDPIDWQSSLTEEELQRLTASEKERQDIINELFLTEKSHVHNLGILDRIFMRGIKDKAPGALKDDEMQLIFSNLYDIIKVHTRFKHHLKHKKSADGPMWKEMGECLLTMFDGELGEFYKRSAATFCEKQQCALDLIKEKRRKDTAFSKALNDLEKSNECRRLPFQGFILSEMQRLSKYPLLIERLINLVEKNNGGDDAEQHYSAAELRSLNQALDRSREILNHVNDAAERAWGRFRLEEIQNHLDMTMFLSNKDHQIVVEFKNIDLTNYNLIHDGPVELKRQNKAHLHVHMVLLDVAVILLQKEGDKFLLKFFQSGKPGQPLLAPIIKMSTLLVRTNAAYERSLFLVNTSAQNSYIYELVTRDYSDRKTWFTYLSNAVEAYKRSEGKMKQSEPLPDEEETVSELPPCLQETPERADAVVSGGEPPPAGDSERKTCEGDAPPSGETPSDDGGKNEPPSTTASSSSSEKTENSSDNENVVGGGVSTKFTADDWPLIQPSEVHTDIPPVHSADAVLTPIEQIRRKGDDVRKALEDKEKLIADLLNIPREDYHHIADMATEESKQEVAGNREPTELILASLYQVDQLLKAVNESTTMTDVDAVLLKGGKNQSCASNQKRVKEAKDFTTINGCSIHTVQEAATTLNTLLTQLLSIQKQREEERQTLKKELSRTRELLHEKLSLECSAHNAVEDAPVESVQSEDLESIEESLKENDTN